MKIEVKVTTKKAVVLLVIAAALLGVAGVIAFSVGPGSVPNPGHPLSGVQGYFSGDATLQDSLGKFCQLDGTNCKALAIDMNERTCPQNNDCPIDCDSGDLLLGGGFNIGSSIVPPVYSRPQSDLSGWQCRIGGTGGSCYVVCLDVA
jgi:hypothetical protein